MVTATSISTGSTSASARTPAATRSRRRPARACRSIRTRSPPCSRGDGDLASKLRELGAALDKRYEGDVRRIREDAGQDPARERALLGELPGTDDSARGALGPIGTTRPPTAPTAAV